MTIALAIYAVFMTLLMLWFLPPRRFWVVGTNGFIEGTFYTNRDAAMKRAITVQKMVPYEMVVNSDYTMEWVSKDSGGFVFDRIVVRKVGA